MKHNKCLTFHFMSDTQLNESAFLKFSNQVHISKPTLITLFSTALILMISVAIFSMFQINALLFANKRVMQTYEVIQTMDDTLFEVISIESKKRGFLMTDKEYFLKDIEQSKTQLKEHIAVLLDLTQDNASQKQRILEFNDQIKDWLMLLNEMIQLKATNRLDGEQGNDLLNRNQDLSSRVKGLGQKIKAVEEVILQERNKSLIKRSKTVSVFLLVGFLISITALLIAFILTIIELGKRKNAELTQKQMQDQLRKIIETTKDMIAAFDEHHRFLLFNDKYKTEFKRIFNKNIHIGMSLEEALTDVDEELQTLANQWLETLTKNDKIQRLKAPIHHHTKFYEITTGFIQNGDSQFYGVVQNILDITKQTEAEQSLKQSYDNITLSMKALQSKNEQVTLLVEMSDIMLACNTQHELTKIIANYSTQLLDWHSGYLYIMHPSKNHLEKYAQWGETHDTVEVFSPDDCWAIRLGRVYNTDSQSALKCNHIHDKAQEQLCHVCVPLMAQNDIYGLFFLESAADESPILDENQKLLLTALAELTALALANIRLRENLQYQSLRDPLTGLYNRRYLDDFLFKQLNQAKRTESTFSILMLDLDHFKSINDNYGHEAGDAVLSEVAHLLQHEIRDGDIASRYGGEEFVILLYNIDLEHSLERAEMLRQSIDKLQVKYGAQQVASISVSIGVACYPKDADTPEKLILAADKALYAAKHQGRNQVKAYYEIAAL